MAPEAAAFRTVREERRPGGLPLYSHPQWTALWPWLCQATSGAAGAFDLSFFGQTPVGTVMSRWNAIRQATAFPAIVHARQVHGATVLYHKHAHGGVNIADDADGHVTSSPGALLAVSIADCVPISLVDPETRSIALLHAGWRGVAEGILERGVAQLAEKGSSAAGLHAHFGPAICGQCYEVGREVFEGIGVTAPGDKACVNLRGILAERAIALGIARDKITVSAWCTRCDGEFFSHRGGDRERQMALLGVRKE
jgi:polyphenol oxidase